MIAKLADRLVTDASALQVAWLAEIVGCYDNISVSYKCSGC